jgi:hypothetical protein
MSFYFFWVSEREYTKGSSSEVMGSGGGCYLIMKDFLENPVVNSLAIPICL